MVFFSQIASSISENKEAGFQVASFSLKRQENVDQPSKCFVKEVPKRISVECIESNSGEEISIDTIPLPVPTRSVHVQPLKPRVPEPRVPEPRVPEPRVPEPRVQIVSNRPESPKPPVQVSKPTKNTKGMDPISIGMALRDPMYEIATQQVKQSLEAEEAQRMESNLDALYKSESGRSRGWVKTQLTAFLLPRAASGSYVIPKEVFSWEDLRTNKKTSAILDFVCLAKGIRIAVWYDTKETYIWPAADKSTQSSTIPIFHFHADGRPARKDSVVEHGWTLRPPLSVEHSLEKLTLDELDSLAQKLGLPELSGKKTDRIREIASYRTKLRFDK